MKISSNFSLVLSSKVNQNQNFTNFRANFNDSNDKFVSQNSVSFKANAPAKAITDMIKSKSYWKIVGATVAFVSAAIWEALKKSGVQEDDITLDQIQDMIKEFSPQGSMTSNEGETSVLVNLPEIRRGRKKKIKEEQKVETSATQPTVTPEVAPAEEKSKPKVKTTKLAGGKQKDVNSAVSVYQERAQKVQEMLDQGMSQYEIAKTLGISQPTVSLTIKKCNLKASKSEKEESKVETSAAQPTVTPEVAPVEEKSKPKVKTTKLAGGKQKDKSAAVVKYREKVQKIQEMLAQGMKPNQIANELGISTAGVYNIMKAEGILPPTKRNKVKTTQDVKYIKRNFNKNSIEKFFQEHLFVNVKIDEALQSRINELSEEFKEELDIIRSLNSAREEIRINKNKLIQSDIKSKEVKPESIENSLEYLYEHLMAHIYKIFCERAKQKNQTVEEAVEGLCAVANHVRTIFNAGNPDFINDVWNMRFSEIPEGDPLFEKFKQCYNKEENLSRIKKLKSKFIDNFVEKISKTDFIDSIKDANSNYDLNIENQLLLNLLLYPEMHSEFLVAEAKVPEFQEINGEENQTQINLKEAISKFKTVRRLSEYVDLVNIYNTHCANNYNEKIAGQLLLILSSISNVDEISEGDLAALKSVITLNRQGIDYESKVSEQKESELSEQRRIEEEHKGLVKKIDDFQDQLKNEELEYRLLDFTLNSNSEESDIVNLRKMLILVGKISKGEMTAKQVNEICDTENIKPINSDFAGWKEKRENELRNEITTQIASILGKQKDQNSIMTLVLIEILDSSLLEKMVLARLQELSSDISKIEEQISYKPNEAEKFAKILAKKYLPKEKSQKFNITDEAYFLTQKNAEFTRFLNGEIELDDEISNFVRNEYRKTLGTNTEIGIGDARICLRKIEEYNSLSAQEKTYITKILEIFDEKNGSKLEKTVLRKIIEKYYMNVDTIIENQINGEIVIHNSIKKDLWKRARYTTDLFVLNERAALLSSDGKRDGVKYLNGEKRYEIKISGDYGNTRLKCGTVVDSTTQDGKPIRRLIFDIFELAHMK